MRRQLVPGLRMLLLMTMLTGLLYTLGITAISQLSMGHLADGSLLVVDGEMVGSKLIGQAFATEGLFHPRPSAAEYDPRASGATNYGPSNPELLDAVETHAGEYRSRNGLSADDPVPVDAVTSSASGLDPHISVANARLQAPRVASLSGISLEMVLELIDENTTRPPVWFLGQPAVNVVTLNLALLDASQ
jgi:potassium-transporting ATPase KdpC subunit